MSKWIFLLLLIPIIIFIYRVTKQKSSGNNTSGGSFSFHAGDWIKYGVYLILGIGTFFMIRSWTGSKKDEPEKNPRTTLSEMDTSGGEDWAELTTPCVNLKIRGQFYIKCKQPLLIKIHGRNKLHLWRPGEDLPPGIIHQDQEIYNLNYSFFDPGDMQKKVSFLILKNGEETKIYE